MTEIPSSLEEAVELFLGRRHRGELVDPKAFSAVHPQLAPELERALEALIALERDTVERDTEQLPERIGSFRVVRELGRGGMGVVLEAVEEPLHRRVALKVLPPELLSSQSARARFRREAELAARLDHPGIATIYGAGVENDRPWIAMRFVEGRTLAREIADARPEAHRDSRRDAILLARVARALHSAHEQGVVHRDIKPSNIIVSPDGSPVLLDFGLAITEESDGHSLTRTGEAPGTPAYLPPEMVSGELPRRDVQSDVYALGVTLYEYLALRHPFDAPTPAALYHAILTGTPVGLRTLNRSVSRDLAVVTATAMERDRSRRYRSALALAEDLEACVAGRPIAARPVPLHGRVARWARREPRLALAITAAIVIAIGGLAWVSIVQTAAGRVVARKNEELSATNSSLAAAKTKSEENERVATQKADDVLSLSAVQDLQDLVDRAERLWPAEPEHIARYEDWLRDARGLLEGRAADPVRGIKAKPGLAEHKRKLAEIEARALPRSEADSENRWWHVQLAKLITDLQAFSDPKTGLYSSGISSEHGWGIERRLEFARACAERSVSGPEASTRWAEAIASIRDPSQCPRYRGLVIAPQLGLLPLGRDAHSGLWEFANLETGEPALRGPDRKLVVTESMGLVFVLIPGGTFWMGAQRTDPNGRNHDPQARSSESPVHEVELSPYFLSKYEMTQGQWLRFVGRNPSYYGPGSKFNGHEHDLRHPVENVSATDCTTTMERLGLALPSEAQWENAARGGTTTPWWTGEDRESLRGNVNVADLSFVQAGGLKSIADEWPDLEDGWGVHAPVGTFAPNPFGLSEVLGNVWEWCQDGYDSGFYGKSTAKDPVSPRPGTDDVVSRGGSFNDAASLARSALRHNFAPEDHGHYFGLRPARSLTATTGSGAPATR